MSEQLDIAIVGAGFAGLNLAHALRNSSLAVAVIDKRETFPDIFRAEKIEPHQAEMMREIGTLKYRTPKSDPIGTTLNVSGEHVYNVDTVEQYCISYSSTVNTMRENLPEDVSFLNHAVSKIEPGTLSRILLDNGDVLRARLVVLACGLDAELSDSLDIQRTQSQELASLTFGFFIKRADLSDFDFNGLNYFLPEQEDNVQYITIFPIGERMRANVFTQLKRSDTLAKELRNDTLATIDRLFPRLDDYLGRVVLDSKVQVMPTHYYSLFRQDVPGVVAIGDSFQSVSPATGSGLSKVLTDVQMLSQTYIPEWFKKDSISAADVSAFYKDKRKVTIDRRSLKSWYYAGYGEMKRPSLLTRISRFIQLCLRYGVRSG